MSLAIQLQRILLGAVVPALPVWQPLIVCLLVLTAASASCAEPPAAANDTSTKVDAAKVERHALELLAQHDYAAAARELAVAAEAGRPVAQFVLGDQLARGTGIAVDLVQAFKWLSAAARQGVAGAQSTLGLLYFYGQGTQTDTPEALRWLAAAARQDEPTALRFLSLLYSSGDGVPKDPALAEQLLRRAAELNDPEACRRLGLRFLYGAGVPRDSPQGLELLRKAADNRDSSAAYALGWWYLSRQPNALDLRTAARWIEASAAEKHALAALWRSQLYRAGLGVRLSSSKARELLEQALALAELTDKNEFAWQLSVNPDSALRNGPLAVSIMQTALVPPGARTPQYLDTMAAAYAEAGKFEQAVKTQQAALAALTPEQRATDREMHERLQIYLAGRPFRETPR